MKVRPWMVDAFLLCCVVLLVVAIGVVALTPSISMERAMAELLLAE